MSKLEWQHDLSNIPRPMVDLWWLDESTCGITLLFGTPFADPIVSVAFCDIQAPPWLRRFGDWRHHRQVVARARRADRIGRKLRRRKGLRL